MPSTFDPASNARDLAAAVDSVVSALRPLTPVPDRSPLYAQDHEGNLVTRQGVVIRGKVPQSTAPEVLRATTSPTRV